MLEVNDDKGKIIAIIAIIGIVAMAGFVFIISNFFKMSKRVDDIDNRAIDMFDKVIDKAKNTSEVVSFNSDLEMYIGTKFGSQVSVLLDNVVTKIKKNTNRSINVVYGDKEVSNPEDIIKLKSSFDDMTRYEVSFDYDSDGFVNKVTIYDK